MEKVKCIPHSVYGKLSCMSVRVRRCTGAMQFSVSEGEVGLFGRARSDLRGVRLGSPRSPEESGVDI